MYLELAENNNQGYYGMMAQKGEDTADLYLYMPANITGGEGMYVREDTFDLLPDDQWNQLQDILEPYQERNMSLFGLGKKGRERRRVRREARWAARESRITIRGESGGGILGGIGDVVKDIFAPKDEPMEPLPTLPAQKAGFMGMPNWVIPVVAVGGIITVLAMTGRGKRKRK